MIEGRTEKKMDASKIDLHMHSTVSDGTDAPVALLEQVRKAGLELFALTDHDAVKGCRAIRDARRPDDPLVLNGVEFSCRDEDGKYHILGYGFDPDSPSMTRVIEKGHGLRMTKLAERLDFIRAQYGFAFPEEVTRNLYSLDNPGKPHIGNLMVEYGYADSKEQAIDEYLNRANIHSEYIRPEEAIQAILQGDGIPVLAHPSFGSGDELIVGEEMESRLRKLIDFGLQGVEAYYSGFSPRLRTQTLFFAEKFKLYITAGSDYHGRNKLVVLGDTGLNRDHFIPSGMRRFLEEVNYD